MGNKDFIIQRICIYAGREFDPGNDTQVIEVLRSKFAVHLPQRASVNESLAAATSDHDILGLIMQYRTMG